MEVIFALFFVVIYFLAILGAIIASIISSFVMAIAIGAIPLMCGFIKKKKALGCIGFAACFVLYLLYGFYLAQIASIVFTFFIVKDKKAIAE